MGRRCQRGDRLFDGSLEEDVEWVMDDTISHVIVKMYV